jgi:hypothetical protein
VLNGDLTGTAEWRYNRKTGARERMGKLVGSAQFRARSQSLRIRQEESAGTIPAHIKIPPLPTKPGIYTLAQGVHSQMSLRKPAVGMVLLLLTALMGACSNDQMAVSDRASVPTERAVTAERPTAAPPSEEPDPTASPTLAQPTETPQPTASSTATQHPGPIEFVVLHTNDSRGYVEPCG